MAQCTTVTEKGKVDSLLFLTATHTLICVKWSILTVKSKIRSGSAGRWELPLGKKIHMTRTSFPEGLPIDYSGIPILLVTIITPRVSGVGV